MKKLTIGMAALLAWAPLGAQDAAALPGWLAGAGSVKSSAGT